jgi:hypothetical protein
MSIKQGDAPSTAVYKRWVVGSTIVLALLATPLCYSYHYTSKAVSTAHQAAAMLLSALTVNNMTTAWCNGAWIATPITSQLCTTVRSSGTI